MSGVGFFVVTDGEAAVSVGGNDVKTIGAGDHFGETRARQRVGSHRDRDGNDRAAGCSRSRSGTSATSRTRTRT